MILGLHCMLELTNDGVGRLTSATATSWHIKYFGFKLNYSTYCKQKWTNILPTGGTAADIVALVVRHPHQIEWQPDNLKHTATATAGGEHSFPHELNRTCGAINTRMQLVCTKLKTLNAHYFSVPFGLMFSPSEPKGLSSLRFKKCTDGYETHACCNPQVMEHSYVIN